MYPHQPGEPPRDPARPALTSRRNTLVPANAAVHALRQNQGGDTDYRPHRSADPRAARRKISPATQPTTLWRRRRYHRRRHAKPEIPIHQPKRPAGSYLGGFRTPDGARKPSPLRPFRGIWGLLLSGRSPHAGAVGETESDRSRLGPLEGHGLKFAAAG